MSVLFRIVSVAVLSLSTLAAIGAQEERLADCSVGGASGASWYGNVVMGQNLKINKATHAVEVVRDFEDYGSDYLVVNVDLRWITPRYVPKDIILTTHHTAAYARDAITYSDRLSGVIIYCSL